LFSAQKLCAVACMGCMYALQATQVRAADLHHLVLTCRIYWHRQVRQHLDCRQGVGIERSFCRHSLAKAVSRMLLNKLTSIVNYVCFLWVGDNDRDQITCSYVVMAKDLKCFLGLTFILAQQPLQILQASCAQQDKIIGATLTCFLPSAISYNVRNMRIQNSRKQSSSLQ